MARGSSPISAWAQTDLPDPNSPTRQSDLARATREGHVRDRIAPGPHRRGSASVRP